MKSKISLLLLSLGIITSCGNKMTIPEASTEYATMVTSFSSSTLNVSYPATIKGKQDIEIRPKVAGFITKVCVDEGTFVRKGQPLFILDRVQFEAAVKSARASVRVAEANVATQKLTVANKRELRKQEIISAYDLQMAENTLASLEANLAQAKAALTNALNDLSYTTVTSPADGFVGTIPYRVGSLVSSSSPQALTTVSNINEMYVYFSMTEKQLLDLTRGNARMQDIIKSIPEVKLQLADGSEYAYGGHVETISGVIDQTTGSVQIRATFPNPNKELRSGGTGNVLIPQINSKIVIIPQKATYEIQDKKFVYVVRKDSTVIPTEIKVESQNDGTNYIVKDGLTSGQTIVVEGISSLKANMKIKPITVKAADQKRRQAEKERAESEK